MNQTHRMSHTPEHDTWIKMRARCRCVTSRDYAAYGGRGITVSPRWDDFANFLADMGPRPEGLTLDRIDNDGNYEPSNCRWATAEDQANNRRSNRCVEIGGVTRTVAEWARHSGIRHGTLIQRLHQGWRLGRLLEPTVFNPRWHSTSDPAMYALG